ncbi:hypothetical protein [Solicola gregarius]|uniref:Uncharacterized protein n=1 Tax=Solicola gregarius TaxID=2908642 RepID=A0AA46TER2_9ACTN|nr:hypothetical protein [Solicola gregarius]UYM03800.1 hypothetical protein L0C25_14755 [Solicola gregarius]
MSVTRIALVGIAAIALAGSVAAPADADVAVVKDKRGDVSGQVDIRSVRVDNTGKWIDIRSHHRNLTYGPHAPGLGASLFIDTNGKRKGPEFIIGGPVGSDGDYHLSKLRGWNHFGRSLGCKMTYRVNYKRDVVRFAAKRPCLARAYDRPVNAIRVSVRISQENRHGPGTLTDWAPRFHRFHPPVGRA